jgi:hypothetical protein
MSKRILLAIVLLGSTLAMAQTASISGVVTDRSGAVVSSAEIVVTAADTGAVRSATSEATGTFWVPSLAVGNYRVEVNKRGFAGVGHRLGAVQNAMLVRC